MKASEIVAALQLAIQEVGDLDTYITWDYYPAKLSNRRFHEIRGVGDEKAHEGVGGSSDASINIQIQP